MKKNSYFFLLIIFAAVALSGCCLLKKTAGTSQKGYREPVKIVQKIIPPTGKLLPGEMLTFKVTWLGMHVGTATLEVAEGGRINNKDAFRVILKAKTNAFFSFFYKVEGTVESYVDSATFRPIKYNSHTQINKKFVFKEMEYDFVNKKVYAVDKKGNYELEITPDTLDPLGVFYYFRRHPVIMDEPVNLHINGGKKNFSVTIYVRRQHLIKTPAGRFWAFQVEPTRESEHQFDDSLNAEGSMRMWFSADEKRLPLIVALKVPVGTAQAVLTKVSFSEAD